MTSRSETWLQVDAHLADLFLPHDDALDAALSASTAAGLPPIHVSAMQGRLLHLLARMCRARSILEIGTLGGYSTIWLARALPSGGRVVTLESQAAHAGVARANLARAGVAERVDLRLGPALETLPELQAEGAGPFDLVFIDADKEGYVDYLEWSLRLTAPGSVIIADNVVRKGTILEPRTDDPKVQGVTRFNAALAVERRVTATVVQTVGEKGHDGFALAIVL